LNGQPHKTGKIIIVVLAILAVSGIAFQHFRGSHVKIQYRTAEVERGTLRIAVTATGIVNPVNTVDVGTQTSGTISNIYVDFNTKVRKGQVIARLDTHFLEAGIQDASANVQKGQIDVAQTKLMAFALSAFLGDTAVERSDLSGCKRALLAREPEQKQQEIDIDARLLLQRNASLRHRRVAIELQREPPERRSGGGRNLGRERRFTKMGPQQWRVAEEVRAAERSQSGSALRRYKLPNIAQSGHWRIAKHHRTGKRGWHRDHMGRDCDGEHEWRPGRRSE